MFYFCSHLGMDASEHDKALASDIAYAIWKAAVPGLKRELSGNMRRPLAEAIVRHLHLCNWDFRPPGVPPLDVAVSQRSKRDG